MPSWKRPAFWCLLAVVLVGTPAASAIGDPQLAELFAERGVTGTIVLSTLDGATEYVHDEARAARPYLPASTFKIPNTLIALAEGAIRDGEILPWDGMKRDIEAWNHDHTLATAFPVSCVPFYQELAHRVGLLRYKLHLLRLKYGNGRAGPAVETFWLNGDLRISARQQIDFLRRLVRHELPFTADHYGVLERIMTVASSPQATLRAKTGWAFETKIGWYVGWVQTPGRTWLFALNLDTVRPGDVGYRKELVLAALRAKGIPYPPSAER